MLIVATVLVLALIGFFVAIGLIIANILSFTGTAKRTVRMVGRPTRSVTQIANLVHGIYLRSAVRAEVMGGNAKQAWVAASAAYRDVSGAAKSVDFEGIIGSGSAGKQIFKDVQQAIIWINAIRKAIREQG